jgi:GH15 family glucan-1,4-alpha-glucosidase
MNSLDLAVVGNCNIAALIDRKADLVWMCFPRFDADPVFCSLLNDGPAATKQAGQGRFSIELPNMTTCEQGYVENTAVFVSVLADDKGNAVEITDFMPRFQQFERLFRPPMLIRRVVPLRGQPRIRVRLKPLFGWGALEPKITIGSNHVRFVGPSHALRLTTDVSVSYIDESQLFLVHRPISFVFGADEALVADIDQTARDFLERTVQYWRGWVRSLSIPFEWQGAVIRAAITLKLCNFEETGAIVAALTTSIPEAPGTERNWDYRYCWLRDAYFVIHALNRLGVTRTMEDYIAFIENVVQDSDSGELQPLYGITRNTVLEEEFAPALTGYRGLGPVRVGNAAYAQKQYDVYGSIILAATHSFFDQRLSRSGLDSLFASLERLGEIAARMYDKPDAGLWELRSRSAIHTFSSIMCWAACDRLAKISVPMNRPERSAYWQNLALRIHAVILERAWNPSLNSFVASFEGHDLDASLLLMHALDFLPAGDERFVATVDAIGRSLKKGNLLLRYAAEDDFGKPTAAFVICTFWYIDALHAVGRREEAHAMFDNALNLRNSFGLFSEDVDMATGELWGNFPQTYSMVGLINSAMRLSKSWEDAF